MKQNTFVFFIIFLIVCLGCKENRKYAFETFSPSELRMDLKSVYNKLDTTHYNLYHLHQKADFDSVYQHIYDGINHPLNACEFYFQLLPLFNLLQDSHSMLGFPFSFNKEFSKQGGKFIPIKVFIINDKIFVSEIFSKTSFPIYSEIISVNEIKSSEIIKTLHLMINREQQESENDYMSFFFHRILYPVYGFDENFVLELITPNNEYKKITLSGISLDDFPKENISNFHSWQLNNSTVVIDINSCENKEEFATFCDSIFDYVHKNKTKSLVIDLRNNPGGSTFHGDTLFTYLTNKKFTQYYKRSIKYSAYSNPKSDSIYIKTFASNLEQSHINKKRFKGKVYMLINQGTFSSASLMAATFKCYKMGTLIGQKTGGTQIFFDEPIDFKLKNTKLRFLVSNQVNYCPCARDWNNGIIPDIIIPFKMTDKIDGIDTEIEYLKTLTNEKE